ncbi:MAG TPA: outer membrane beta-barrel protein [Thermoanaerobaculia bacterium]|nr:outer membrane beta-barrel protein [Thermoanaerobaculia bacterium]
MKKIVLALMFAMLLTPALAGQETEPRDTRQSGDKQAQTNPSDAPWQFWLKGNGQLYENFFQAVEGGAEEDVTALYGEVGASFRIVNRMRVYGDVNYLHYNENDLDASTGIRIGLRNDAQPHSFDVYVEHLQDRPSFDVGDEFDRADIRTVAADYGWRFTHDWSLGVDGEIQHQEFDITEGRDNDFAGAGASIRWRGSRLFSPELGVRIGNRDVDDDSLSYDQRDVYLQIRSALTPKWYLSGRIRNRSRDYNSNREDTRRQLTLGADYSIHPNLVLNLYGAHESTDVNLAGRDFDTTLWMAGLTWKF